MAPATDADEKDPARALARDPEAFQALYQREQAPAAHPEATIAPAPSPAEPARAVPAPAAPAAAPAPPPAAAASEYSDDDDDDDDDGGVEWSPEFLCWTTSRHLRKVFRRKLLDLVNDRNVPEIAWNEDGTGVSFQKGPALDRVLGDRFAAKNEWATFLRQLNEYNFTRSSREGNTVVYENASFTRTSTPAQIATIPRRSATATRQATGTPAVEAPLPEEEDPDPAACRKRKRDATGHFAARKKAGGRVPKQAVPNEHEWAEFRAKRDGAPLHDLLDLFADSDDE